MQTLHIIYNWTISMQVYNKNGRKYNNHITHTLGHDYPSAYNEIVTKLKKKKWKLVAINKVNAVTVCCAHYSSPYADISSSNYKTLPLPHIPQTLNPPVKIEPKMYTVYDMYDKEINFYNLEDKIAAIQREIDFNHDDPAFRLLSDHLRPYREHLLRRLLLLKEKLTIENN